MLKTRAYKLSNSLKLQRRCFLPGSQTSFFFSNVTSFLYDVISLFYTKRHKDPFLMGAINYTMQTSYSYEKKY